MLSPQELATIKNIANTAAEHADSINKVWIAGTAVIASVIAILVGAITQLWIARQQRAEQRKLATHQSKQQKGALAEQISMQELSSRRIAAANIAAKRQVWIDELRKEVSSYLTIWQEIAYRWDAIVSQKREASISDTDLEEFKKPIIEMRKDALQLRLSIELRLNASEEDHQLLLTLMDELESLTTLYQRDLSGLQPKWISGNFKEKRLAVLVKAQEILKAEWERIKRESYLKPIDPNR